MVIFVIGCSSAGKSRFIEQSFKGSDYAVLDVYDYQTRAAADRRFRGLSGRERLFEANEQMKADLCDLVRQGRDVVAEQTFFRALRRIDFIDAIRKISGTIPVVVYVVMPSDEQLLKNCRKRAEGTGVNPEYTYARARRDLSEVFEFPNRAEGFSRIYEVSDSGITERVDRPDWARIEQARRELAAEAEKRRREREARKRRERLAEEMEHIRFWHICEVCGKRELLTAEEAFVQGWDYPPRVGHFQNIMTPRTCGSCPITDSLCFKLLSGKKTFSDLSEEEKKTLERITNEPESLLPSEDER